MLFRIADDPGLVLSWRAGASEKNEGNCCEGYD
jgi:hypothetical protein